MQRNDGCYWVEKGYQLDVNEGEEEKERLHQGGFSSSFDWQSLRDVAFEIETATEGSNYHDGNEAYCLPRRRGVP